MNQYVKDFPMLKKTMHGHPLIYLDSAATAQKPQSVIDAVTEFYRDYYGTVHRAVYELANDSTNMYHEARLKAQKFLGAKLPEEIIFTRGTTDAINLAAYSFGKALIKPGDEIIISEIEHHANIVPWQMVCEDRGAKLKVIPVDERGVLKLGEYEKLLSPKTKIVAIAHISNALGTIHPVKQIIEMAHQAGAKVLIDGAQAAPSMKIDMQDLDADFYAFSGHKAYGPSGIGVLYGKYDLLDRLPPMQGGGDMIDTVSFDKTTYQKPPLKFEAGTPQIAQAVGLGAAIDYINSIGIDNIAAWKQHLLAYATKRLESIPHLSIMGTAPEKGAIISFNVANVHPLDIGTMLDLKGIAVRTGSLCAQPAMARFGTAQTTRASFALYNSTDQIDIFADALEEIISLVRK